MTGAAVLVLGGGFAGIEVARRLEARAEVTLVSDDNFLLFSPMLAEVAAADVDPRHIVSPIRQLCPDTRLVVGTIEEIDPGARSVWVRPQLGRPPVRYQGDALVLALGSVPATFGVEGVGEHALPFKSIADALRIRNRVLALLDAATESGDRRHTTLVVVGAGFSGAEVAAALQDFLSDAVPRFFPDAPSPRVILIDAVDRAVPALPARLSAAAERALRRRGVEVVLGKSVAGVHRDGVTLEDGRTFPASTVIWSAGVRPHPLVDGLGLPTDATGRVLVDSNLRAAPGIYALGDLAAVPDGRGGTSPPTAQFAIRQGRYLGRHLPALLAGDRGPPFRYRSLGQLVSLGHRNAVGLVLGIRLSGLPAWFLWRSYYLGRLPTLLRKARVAIDWTLDLLFPPDIAWLPGGGLGPPVEPAAPPQEGSR